MTDHDAYAPTDTEYRADMMDMARSIVTDTGQIPAGSPVGGVMLFLVEEVDRLAAELAKATRATGCDTCGTECDKVCPMCTYTSELQAVIDRMKERHGH